MYVLYEGKVKVGFESETLLEMFDKLNWGVGEEEYNSEPFNGEIDVYQGTEEWKDHIDALHPVENYEEEDPEACREKSIKEWLREIGVPHEIGVADSVICVTGHGAEIYRLFITAPTPDDLNALFAECMPNMGYRIVEE